MKTRQFPRTLLLISPAIALFSMALTGCDSGATSTNAPDKPAQPVNLLASAQFDTARLVPVTNEINLTGKITFNQDKVVKVFPLVGGHIETVKADLGAYVEKGQTLAVIRSGEMADVEQQTLSARGQLAVAQKNNQVTEDMAQSGLASQRDLVAAREQLQAAKGEVSRVTERRSILGGSGSAPAGRSVYIVKAPVSGYVVEKTAAPGMELRSDDPENLFTISNLDHVWVMANVYESDVSNVHEGDPASITTLAYPDKVYQGRIDKVFNVLDPDSKTEKVRITLLNADRALKPEMFTNVSVQYPGRDRRVAIPAKAIVFAESRNFVIVVNAHNQPIVREVDPFKTIGATTYLTSGIQPGERVVTQNQLLIYNALGN